MPKPNGRKRQQQFLLPASQELRDNRIITWAGLAGCLDYPDPGPGLCGEEQRMEKKRSRGLMVILVFLLLVPGCSRAGKPSAPAATPGEEETLVAFMRDEIVKNEIEGMIDYIKTQSIPGIETPPEAFLIVWRPVIPAEGQGQEDMPSLDTSRVSRVWLYKGGRLTVQEDGQKAVDDYQHKVIDPAPSDPSIFMWGYYEFGILSRSEKEARIYLSASCGSLCGHGLIYTLQRAGSGEWKITDQKELWMS
jgi:hypothetical protein